VLVLWPSAVASAFRSAVWQELPSRTPSAPEPAEASEPLAEEPQEPEQAGRESCILLVRSDSHAPAEKWQEQGQLWISAAIVPLQTLRLGLGTRQHSVLAGTACVDFEGAEEEGQAEEEEGEGTRTKTPGPGPGLLASSRPALPPAGRGEDREEGQRGVKAKKLIDCEISLCLSMFLFLGLPVYLDTQTDRHRETERQRDRETARRESQEAH